MIPHPSEYVPQWAYILVCSDGQQRTGKIYKHQGCHDLATAQEFCDLLFGNSNMVSANGSHSFRVLSATAHPIV